MPGARFVGRSHYFDNFCGLLLLLLSTFIISFIKHKRNKTACTHWEWYWTIVDLSFLSNGTPLCPARKDCTQIGVIARRAICSWKTAHKTGGSNNESTELAKIMRGESSTSVQTNQNNQWRCGDAEEAKQRKLGELKRIFLVMCNLYFVCSSMRSAKIMQWCALLHSSLVFKKWSILW